MLITRSRKTRLLGRKSVELETERLEATARARLGGSEDPETGLAGEVSGGMPVVGR